MLLLALVVLWRALSKPHREEPLKIQSCTHAAFATDIWCRTRGRIMMENELVFSVAARVTLAMVESCLLPRLRNANTTYRFSHNAVFVKT